jgi:hypothetical protein
MSLIKRAHKAHMRLHKKIFGGKHKHKHRSQPAPAPAQPQAAQPACSCMMRQVLMNQYALMGRQQQLAANQTQIMRQQAALSATLQNNAALNAYFSCATSPSQFLGALSSLQSMTAALSC